MNQSHRRNRVTSMGIFLLVAMVAFQCLELPPSPVAPTFDVQGSIPLLDRRFTVADFEGKDEFLSTGPDGGLEYTSSQIFDPIGLGPITVQPKASSQQVELGLFDVEQPSIPTLSFTWDQITGGAPRPTDSPLPATSFTIPGTAIGPLSGFEYIEFEGGTISLRIQNTLPVPITLPDPILLKNDKISAPVDTNLAASFTFSGQIAADGGEQTQSANLANVTLQSLLRLPAVSLSTPGSGGQPVTVNPSDGVVIEVTIANAQVRAARATIPSQSVFSFADSTFVVDDSVTISSAFFTSGLFSIVIENNINVEIAVFVRFSELQDRVTSMPFEINPQFTGIETRSIGIDMSTLKLQSLVDSIGTRATFTVGVSTISNQDSTREVRSTDYVRVSIAPGPPVFVKAVTGRIKPTLISVQTGASGFSLGEAAEKFEGEFTFDSLEIALDFSSSSGFPTDYDVWFVARNRKPGSQKIDSLRIPPPVGSVQKRFFPANNQKTSIVLDNTSGLNTFLSKFFPNLPDTFIVRGTMTVNPPDVYSGPEGNQTIYDTSQVNSSVDITFPVKIGIKNAFVRDSVAINVKDQFPKGMAESSRSGTLFFDIDNGLPLALSFRAFLVGTPAGFRDTLLLIPTDGPRIIAPADVDASGNVTSSTISRFSISLVGDDLAKFEASDGMLVQLDVETTNGGSVVRVRNTDFVKLRASANLVYTVNKP
ncbi:MAG: hypothetical protein HYW57_08025 [Ignavibacteriales bacterium]|nr:hypothetical protein [Ignavibacteriales bacterium]